MCVIINNNSLMSSVEGLKMFFSNVSCIVNKIAFQPPKNCLYTIDESKQISIPQIQNASIKSLKYRTETFEIQFIQSQYNSKVFSRYHWLNHRSFVINKPAKKSSVVVYSVYNTRSKDGDNFTMIYSHGNAATLGTIFSFLYDIATQFKCNVVSYDYNGYGKSKGKPSEKHINSNIEDVYYFLRYSLSIPSEKIIVYGHSIGTVPSIDLSSKHNVGGLILECPLASGKLLANPNFELKEDNIQGDSFCSWGKVVNINSPTFLIHGIQDTVIPYEHSILLAEKIIHLVKWFPKNSGHTNVYEKYRSKFVLKVIKFLDYIKTNQNKYNLKINKKGKDL